MAKTRSEHFGIIKGEISKGIDGADFKKIMAASAALKRFAEENRGLALEFAESDGILKNSGNPVYLHKGDFFGKILRIADGNIFAESIGKRKAMASISEMEQENLEIVQIPESVNVAVTV